MRRTIPVPIHYMRVPDMRWRQVCKAVEEEKPPKDAFLKRIYAVMCGDVQDPKIQYVIDLIENPGHRDSIVAYFFARAEIPRIANSLSIPEEILKIFEQLYIDLGVFRNKLEIRDYVKYYLKERCADKETQREVQVGYTNGAVALDFQWCPDTVNVSEKDVTRAALALSYSKMIIARDAPLLSAASKEGLRWAAFALKAAPIHSNMPDKDQDELDAFAAIEKHRNTRQLEDLGITSDQLVH